MTPGRIVTFYSFKGGVGRTMLLANVAWLAARWGHRVLCVDWDLEAPGLDLYLPPARPRDDSPGLLDLLQSEARDHGAWRPFTQDVYVDGGRPLTLLHAGQDGPAYREGVQTIDWAALVENGLGQALEAWREEWLTTYDLVLMDCRTGWSEVAAVGAAQLPDLLVPVINANAQGFQGTDAVIDAIHRARNDAWYDRVPLRVVPVLTRLDKRVEHQRATKWWAAFVARFGRHVDVWRDLAVTSEAVLERLRVPYVPYWSYGEEIAAQRAGWEDPDDLGFAAGQLAALLLHDLSATADLVRSPVAYLEAVGGAPPRSFVWDLHVVHQRADLAAAERLQQQLRARGLKVSITADSWENPLSPGWWEDARHVAFLRPASGPLSQQFQADLETAARLGANRTVLDLAAPGSPPPADPGAGFQRLEGALEDFPARILTALTGEPPGEVAPGWLEVDAEISAALTEMRAAMERWTQWLSDSLQASALLTSTAPTPTASREEGRRWLDQLERYLEATYASGRAPGAELVRAVAKAQAAQKALVDAEFRPFVAGALLASVKHGQVALDRLLGSQRGLIASVGAMPPTTTRIRRARARLLDLHRSVLQVLENYLATQSQFLAFHAQPDSIEPRAARAAEAGETNDQAPAEAPGQGPASAVEGE